jgi:2-C-methyl-D-erythritol 2,4-cyclodiphosphate synthase
MRIGIGYDVHRLVEGRRLFLGGVEVPFDKGLLGHSDGDVLIHAISDAILGAISEGDIGIHFPDSDESIKGIESVKILTHVRELAKKKGYRMVNIDAVIITEEPKVSLYRERIKAQLAEILEIDIASVSVKGKTTEGLGFTGRKEGIAVQAVVLLEKT